MSAPVPQKQIRGIRQGINSGSVLGRKSAGVGPVEEITANDLAQSVINTGQVVTTGGQNPQEWTAGGVNTIGTGLSINATGTISNTETQEWSAGTVEAVGTGLEIVGDTLVATATAGNGMLPLVNGDLPGPSLIADPYGQCIGVAL
jgi:hypothetical protein